MNNIEKQICEKTHVSSHIVHVVLKGLHDVFDDYLSENNDFEGDGAQFTITVSEFVADNSDFVKNVAVRSGLSSDAAAAVCNALFTTLVDTLKSDGEMEIPGLGRFEVSTHKGHPVNLPGEAKVIDDYKVLKFKPSKKFKKNVFA